MHYGADTASFQHPLNAKINWTAAFGDLSARGGGSQPFVIIKFTEGDNYVNPYATGADGMQNDADDSKSAGFAVAAYHFLHASVAAAAQLAYIKANIPSDLGVFLDLEDLGLDGRPEAEMFAVAEGMIGDPQIIGIYVNDSWYRLLPDSLKVKNIWLADPSNLLPGVTRQIEQDSNGPVQGIEGSTDIDVAADLSWLPSSAPIVETPVVTPVAAAAVAPAAPTGISAMPTIEENSADVHFVRVAQGLLNANGSTLTIDGAFGPMTLREVLAFQHGHGLTADGIVGPLTWTALLGI